MVILLPPAHFVPARRGRGRAGHVSRGSASARGDMDLVYSRGEGRLGEETSQLAVRGRLSRIFLGWLTLLMAWIGRIFRIRKGKVGAPSFSGAGVS
eukprot:scaffold11043_cov111-Isochrysis_galbana.AAC.2